MFMVLRPRWKRSMYETMGATPFDFDPSFISPTKFDGWLEGVSSKWLFPDTQLEDSLLFSQKDIEDVHYSNEWSLWKRDTNGFHDSVFLAGSPWDTISRHPH